MREDKHRKSLQEHGLFDPEERQLSDSSRSRLNLSKQKKSL